MRFQYYAETDSLYVELSDKSGVDSREVVPGVVLDLDDEGNLVGIDIDHASKKVRLSPIETKDLPHTTLSFS